MALVRLRPLAAGDLDAVVAIERSTFADPWSKRSFAATLREPHVHALAAVVDDALVGYGISSRVADEGEILNIAVAAASRGQGIGRTLLNALLEDLKAGGIRQVFLEVRRSNEAAIGLYRAAGFRPLGVRPAYYATPREDALTMTLELASQTARK